MRPIRNDFDWLGIQAKAAQPSRPVKASDQTRFEAHLQAKKREVHVSNHAKKRLDLRQLHLQAEDYHQLNQAINELEEKGGKESLLVYKEMGFIANIQNRTIITAMDMEELHTITNIDSAKFIK
ncbi:flagellar protein [Enterococcus sp. LJL98]